MSDLKKSIPSFLQSYALDMSKENPENQYSSEFDSCARRSTQSMLYHTSLLQYLLIVPSLVLPSIILEIHILVYKVPIALQLLMLLCDSSRRSAVGGTLWSGALPGATTDALFVRGGKLCHLHPDQSVAIESEDSEVFIRYTPVLRPVEI